MSDKNQYKLTNIYVKNVKPSQKETLKNIAAYYGHDLSPFLRLKIREMIEKEPEHIKNYKYK